MLFRTLAIRINSSGSMGCTPQQTPCVRLNHCITILIIALTMHVSVLIEAVCSQHDSLHRPVSECTAHHNTHLTSHTVSACLIFSLWRASARGTASSMLSSCIFHSSGMHPECIERERERERGGNKGSTGINAR
jgi:hypothetical protein